MGFQGETDCLKFITWNWTKVEIYRWTAISDISLKYTRSLRKFEYQIKQQI